MNKIETMIEAMSKAVTVEDYETIIRNFGLVKDSSPGIFGVDAKYMVPDFKDLAVFQTPHQLARLLYWLKDKKINSYCEIGVFRGGNFLIMSAFLKHKNPKVRLTCVDPNPDEDYSFIHPDARPYVEPYFIKGTSDDVKGKKFDLVFIDGYHTQEWLNKDYNNIGKLAKYCAIHDIVGNICPEVVRYWQELKATTQKQVIEFIGGYESTPCQGIGVLY